MKRFLSILFIAGALALMIFTKGAVAIFASEPGTYVRTMYSYFSPVPFGYAMFPPLITAVLTCVLLILGLCAVKGKKAAVALCILAPVTFIVSLLPILYGLRFYSLLGACVSLCLLLASVCAIWAMRKKKPPKPAGPPPIGSPPPGSPPPPTPPTPQ